jgi:ferredoxin
MSEARATVLRLDPIRCTAHGMCAELLPERIWLDDWGYPVIDGEPLTPEIMAHARRAAAACPVFALKLEQSSRPAGREAGLNDLALTRSTASH